MKLDITSLYFNGDTKTKGNTASWGTALGQQRPNYPISVEGAQELVDLIKDNHITFTPSTNPNHKANIKHITDERIVASGRFDKIYINQIEFNGPFFLLVVEDVNNSHKGRKILKYNNKISINGESNEEFYKKIQSYFGEDACWFVYDISAIKGRLHMSAVKVSDHPEEYEDATERKDHWESLINDYSNIKALFKKFLLDVHNIKYESTANEYLKSMPKIERWFKENGLATSDYQIFDIRNDNSKIQHYLNNEYQEQWKELNNENNRWYVSPWNRWLEFIEWYNGQIDLGMQNNDFIKFDIEKFEADCNESGLLLESNLITRYIASLASKPFVLLSGLSGSGKSKLAEAFAQWICESEEQYAMIPVGADWTNKEPLLGYPNALKDNEYVKPDNPALDVLIRAQSNPQKPYFLILDEMNLSHVERYFADFLSTMESNNMIDLHNFKDESGNNMEVKNIPCSVSLPKNLFIVGTVNIDETTYMFSPKVLDRANTIEFRVNKDQIDQFLQNANNVNLSILKGKGVKMAIDFIKLINGKDEDEDKIKLNDKQKNIIISFFEELQKSGAEFGYRTAYEISKLVYQLNTFGISDSNEQLDIAIMQKLLPKLHGSRSKLRRTLKPLAKLCVVKEGDDFDKQYFNNFENIDFEKDENIKFKLSFEKIMRMYNNAVENGFASYAEA
ncbi:hypothetical protein NMK71_08065 [Weeksellaceae bacterium KMM 9713]|uniref:Uncharacterized protein n=1 Tax=Profundicola chukchiensis TaxID=2961959 RepID=A0A9X4RV68_9FLAO|nr:hypothetical protein [Profundicola chukchiensis]MDG4946366.1 hypothetical protein [Profundicola chukchiensis]